MLKGDLAGLWSVTVSAIVNGRFPVPVGMALRHSRAFKAAPDLWLYLQKAVDSGKRGKGLGDYVESAPCLHRAISDVHFGCSPPDSAQIPGNNKSPLPLRGNGLLLNMYGASYGTRTCDLLITNQLLYQLS